MEHISFDRISFCYDFIEKYILKDYQGSIDLMNKYLYLQKNYCVIDIGGGTGFFSKEIIEKIRNAVIVDPSYKMLKKIRNPNISVIQGDGGFLSVKNESFDLAIIVNVMHHIHKKDQKKVLVETFRVLKKKGSVFIIEVFFPMTFWNKLFCRFENFTVGKTYHLSAEMLESYLKNVGFTDITMTYPKDHSWKYVVIAQK